MVVGQADGQMRFWRNTRVATLGTNATTTIGTNVIGYEWDEDPDNGFRPPGIFRVSQTAGSGERLQDHGSTYAQGPATHAMTMYRAASGALVFGAGTIQWSWGLDGDHDRGIGRAGHGAPAGDRQPARRHGGPARHAAYGSHRGDRVDRHHRPDGGHHLARGGRDAPGGSPVTITGTATDAGGGRVAGVEVSTDNGSTWQRATGRGAWTYTFTPATAGALTLRARAVDDSARLGAAATGPPSPSGPRDTLPLHDLAGHRHAGRHRPGHQRGRARREVPCRRRRHGHRDPLLQGDGRPGLARGLRCGAAPAPGSRRSRSPTSRPAAGSRRPSRHPSPSTAGTTYVASYFAPTQVRRRPGYFASAATTRTADALQDAPDGGERPLPVHRTPAPSPTRPTARRTTGSTSSSPRPTTPPGRRSPAARPRRERRGCRWAVTWPPRSPSRAAVDRHVRAARTRRCPRSRHGVVRRRQPDRDARPDRRADRDDDLHRLPLRRPRPRRQPDGSRDLVLHDRHPRHDESYGHGTHPGRRRHRGRAGRLADRHLQRGGAAVDRQRSSCEDRQHPGARHDDVRRGHPHGDPRPERLARQQHDLHRHAQRRAGRVGQPDAAGVLVVHDHIGHLGLPVHDLAGGPRHRRAPIPTPARSSSA